VIFGGLLIYFGFMVIQEVQDFKQLIDTPDTMAIGVIVIGFFIFLIAFLGCCGAILESYCILLSFGVVVTIILAVELAFAGLAFAFKADLRDGAEHGLRDALTRYNFTDPDAKYTRLIDDLQWNVKCCGVNNASDWGDRIPLSCCPHEFNATCTLPVQPSTRSPIRGFNNDVDNFGQPSTASPETSPIYERGCVDAVVEAFSNSLGPVGGVCLAVALFQLIGILFAFCLGRAVKREYQVV